MLHSTVAASRVRRKTSLPNINIDSCIEACLSNLPRSETIHSFHKSNNLENKCKVVEERKGELLNPDEFSVSRYASHNRARKLSCQILCLTDTSLETNSGQANMGMFVPPDSGISQRSSSTFQKLAIKDSMSNSTQSALHQPCPFIPCLPTGNENIAWCFVLSVWDNIVGPQTAYVWQQGSADGETEQTGVAKDILCNSRRSRNGCHEVMENVTCSVNALTFEKLETSTDSDIVKNNKSDSVDANQDYFRCIEPNIEDQFSQTFVDLKHQHSSTCRCTKDQLLSTVSNNESNSASIIKLDENMQPAVVLQLPDFCDKINSNQNHSSFHETSLSKHPQLHDAVRYVTDHSVILGEVGCKSDRISTSILVVPHQGIAIQTARFMVEENDAMFPCCLSLVVLHEHYEMFLTLADLTRERLVCIATVARLLISKYGLEGANQLQSRIVALCHILVALRKASLDQYPIYSTGKPPDDRCLAEIMLTSHLQTLGASLVISQSPSIANKLVMWLAQFTDSSKLPVSRLCFSHEKWPFHPGLFVQALARSDTGKVRVTAAELASAMRPLTIVDAECGTVRQTGPAEVAARMGVASLEREITALWEENTEGGDNGASLGLVLEHVRSASPLVKQFLHDHDRLVSCTEEVRRLFVTSFVRSLKYQALALIAWTKHEWPLTCKHKLTMASLRKSLCSAFELEESDFKVLLAQAETLEPGFYAYVMN